jgi:hypothetical protein
MLIVDHQPLNDCVVTAEYNKVNGEVKIDVAYDNKLYSYTRSFAEVQNNVYMALSEAVSKAKKGVML